METRKVIIINNKTQSQKTIMSNANTLGELKAEARNAGVNIEGMTWYEGHMRAELKDDASPLPATVMWKGTETTDLTFLLTQPEKKVKSGAMSRAEAYAKIKAMNLGNACKVRFGKNFTQCSTNDLIELITAAESTCDVQEETLVEANVKTEVETQGSVVDALKVLVNALYRNNCLEVEDYEEVMSELEGKKVTSDKMSRKEIEEMFGFVND